MGGQRFPGLGIGARWKALPAKENCFDGYGGRGKRVFWRP